MTIAELNDLRDKLNLVYDEVDLLDRQIDLLIIKRNNLMNKIESGVAILIKYGND